MDTHSLKLDDGNGDAGHAGRWVFWGFALVAGYFLLTEHRAHLFGILPYLLILACPLMHLFHHHGHRHAGGLAGDAPGGDANATHATSARSGNAPSRPDQ